MKYEDNPEENLDVTTVCLQEGDISCRSFQISNVIPNISRVAPVDKYRLWPKRIIPYVMDSSYDNQDRQKLKKAMFQIEKNACVQFKQRDSETDYVMIKRDKGCYSDVGRTGGCQVLSLDDRCFYHPRSSGIIVHEILHALGFWHEHNRPDRDGFIVIKWDNIIPEKKQNFIKRSEVTVDLLDMDYDYGSIMHYGTRAFAYDKNELSLIPLIHTAWDIVGQREKMSNLDIKKLNTLYKCDIVNCSSPPVPTAGYKVGNDFGVGGMVIFGCEEGKVLIGPSTRFCRFDGRWSGSDPMCIENLNVLTCDFEESLCGLGQEEEDDLDWVRRTGPAPTENTGPIVDHTKEETTGYYLHLDSWKMKSGYTARVVTPTFHQISVRVCLLFYYHMWGSELTTLNVYVRLRNRFNILVWNRTKHVHPEWQGKELAFDFKKEPVQFVFEGVIGGPNFSDLALDDITIYECSRDMEVIETSNLDFDKINPVQNISSDWSCHFEDGLCGLEDDATVDFNWLLNRGKTTTFASGPSIDHTTGTNKGSYLYVEASYPRKPGDRARITSPVFQGDSHDRCLIFYYHMYGEDMGMLQVHVQQDKDISELWHRSGNLGDLWRKKVLHFQPEPKPFQIIFEGQVANGTRSDMALDDIILKTGACDF
ncbi:meprin A subunit beta-like isoform X2 [Tachypleus tridentatus]